MSIDEPDQIVVALIDFVPIELVFMALFLWDISRSLKADPKTIKSKAYRLRLSFPRDGPRISRYKYIAKPSINTIVYKDLNYYRSNWTRLISTNPYIRIKDLRRISPGIYTWLYRNDRKWLSVNIPKRSQGIGKGSYQRINWHQRDLSISSQIIMIVEKINSSPGRPGRLSVSRIGIMIGQLALIQKHIDKLPITAQILSTVTESQIAFAIRRIHIAAECFRNEGIYPKRWELIRRAGVYRMAKQQLIINAISNCLLEENAAILPKGAKR
jgi:hypothetical protein